DPVRFIFTLRQFNLFSEAVIPFMALYLPWLEFILGLFLILGLLYRASAFLLACLNTMFAIAILTVVVRGMEIDCGCFGMLADILKIPDSADIKAIIRNVIFIGISVYIFIVKKTLFSLENYLKKV
ncbi:MAG TPA: MauE/DoxX family redox-associated membrane protein, partial [Thermodesulfovibrionia bacterium]|nr:MauE/DoxX family redox-associated membrane protein [Thermodesulfovibrionia bacterium]